MCSGKWTWVKRYVWTKSRYDRWERHGRTDGKRWEKMGGGGRGEKGREALPISGRDRPEATWGTEGEQRGCMLRMYEDVV